MVEVTIHWCAFAKTKGVSQLTTQLEKARGLSDLMIVEMLFEQTNLYRGDVWNRIHESLPANRSHTALSVGDEIEIRRTYRDEYGEWDMRHLYRCEDFGWSIKRSTLDPKVLIEENLNGPLFRR